MADNISLDQVMDDERYNFISLYESTNPENEKGIDSPFDDIPASCNYYDPEQFSGMTKNTNNACNYFHLKCRGLAANWESFRELLCELQRDNFCFDYIEISEVYKCDDDPRLKLPGFHDIQTKRRSGGFSGGDGLLSKIVLISKCVMI